MKYESNTEKIEKIPDQLRSLTPEQVRALDAAWDAILALLAEDKISEEHFDALYGP